MIKDARLQRRRPDLLNTMNSFIQRAFECGMFLMDKIPKVLHGIVFKEKFQLRKTVCFFIKFSLFLDSANREPYKKAFCTPHPKTHSKAHKTWYVRIHLACFAFSASFNSNKRNPLSTAKGLCRDAKALLLSMLLEQ